MKRLVAIGVALSSLFLLQGTAWAAPGDITPPLVIDTIILQVGGVLVSGTITCESNALYRVRVELEQLPVSNQRRTQGNCTGVSDRFSVFVNGPFVSGTVDFEATAQTGDQIGLTVIDEETASGTSPL